MKNWKTTLSGVLAIVVAVSNSLISMLNGGSVDWPTTAAAVMAGVGLITAKDATAK